MLDVDGSPNVGLYAYATDDYCLIGRGLADEVMDGFKKAFDVPLIEFTLGGSQQVGAYLNGNSKKLLVPSLITEHEIEILKENNIEFEIIETIHTALGNDLIIGETYFFYMPEMEKETVDKIKSILGIDGESLSLKNWDVVGSIAIISSKGGLIQKDVPEDVIEKLGSKLGVEFEVGTVNFGSHVLGGGLVVNAQGMVIGSASAGIEVTNADLAFGFLEK